MKIFYIVLIVFAAFILAVVFIGRSALGQMDFSDEMFGNVRKYISEELVNLKNNGEIDEDQYKLMTNKLMADVDFFEQTKELSDQQVRDRVEVTLAEFENVTVTENVYMVVNRVYQDIIMARQMRDLTRTVPHGDVGAYLLAWFEKRQPRQNKFDAVRQRLSNFEIENKEFKREISEDVNWIEKDTTLTKSQIEKRIERALNHFSEKNLPNDAIMQIGNIYHALANAGGVGKEMNDFINRFYEKNMKQPDSLTYPEMKTTIENRLTAILHAGLIDKSDYDLMKNVMLKDLQMIENTPLSDSLTIVKNLKYGLEMLSRLRLDTEDREFVTEMYYAMSQQKGVNIADILNEWLYGKEMMEKVREKEYNME
ncbi:DUF4844 domain-containing protein [Dysgonomonas sp. 520]|uniref:DUF4844 domain-containing protein n=1 Tax=Dysgonomonas sp. 520 TaxID=2302931 RepID=UPI0013D8888D|nr:DUF4844 domain-containing protein [Dysgonomonas sp. 520]NDW10145.1 hypothetical protein [Dysgonomonas sp. 520]